MNQSMKAIEDEITACKEIVDRLKEKMSPQ